MTRSIKTGSPVKVVDEYGVERDALVTNGFPESFEYDDEKPVSHYINVLFVSGDPARTDQYGRQVERLTSVGHKSTSGGSPGRYWHQP